MYDNPVSYMSSTNQDEVVDGQVEGLVQGEVPVEEGAEGQLARHWVEGWAGALAEQVC